MLYNFKYKTINRFSQSLEDDYKGAFGELEPIYGNYVNWIGRLALENIANSDMLYHDIEHTMLVTTVANRFFWANISPTVASARVSGRTSSRPCFATISVTSAACVASMAMVYVQQGFQMIRSRWIRRGLTPN